ncbi:MAG: hydroxymethylglutaryl-CoA reductase, degradative [Deltaproteobacteria bacterium]|nr:hydroxymethylglutaryl-CoA reductase, degradative [Deltaproteobacteria bacterium]
MSSSRIPGFYKRSIEERRARLAALGLGDDELLALDATNGLQVQGADHMVENAVGVLGLPIGVALNFKINHVDVVIPMAVEESSVVAAVSHIASLVYEHGGFSVESDPPHMVGQIQLFDLDEVFGEDALDKSRALLEKHRADIANHCNELCCGMAKRGGGFVDFELRELPPVTHGPHQELDDDKSMFVFDLVLNCKDAMGANAVNTVVEGMAPFITQIIGGRSHLCILSNLADRRKARASFAIPFAALAGNILKEDNETLSDDERKAIGAEVAQGIVDAYRFAARDPYRACTHNKGILNGVDAVAIATGNDWRAIEAGAHAYAAKDGQYTSLTRFFKDDSDEVLRGSIELPMAIGTVGGSTRIHPTVKACRTLLGGFAEDAERLGGLLAAVGLAQNTGALKALSTEGIQEGHMRLHARQVAVAAGATGEDVQKVADAMVSAKEIRAEKAKDLLQEAALTSGSTS